MKANMITILRNYGLFYGIEGPTCSRALREVEGTEDKTIRAYRRELYIGAFTTILEDLKDIMDPPLIKVFVEIEDTLMNAICAPDIRLDITLMDNQHGDESGFGQAPLNSMPASILKEQLAYLCQEWRKAKGNMEPDCL